MNHRSIAAADDDPGLTVRAALALVDTVGPMEVYVALDADAIRVLPRGGQGVGAPWEVAGPLLRGRVLAAVAPLLTAGWSVDGTFPEAARWDVAVAAGPPLYRGCWLRLRPGNARAKNPTRV